MSKMIIGLRLWIVLLSASLPTMLCVGQGVAADEGPKAGELIPPPNDTLWTLELEVNTSDEYHDANADWKAREVVKGSVQLSLPPGDGPVKQVGVLARQGEHTLAMKGLPLAVNTWTGSGTVSIEGRIKGEVLTFVPTITYQQISQTGTNPVSASGHCSGEGAPISIPLEDGADVVKDIPSAGPITTTGKITWRLRGKKTELWQVTIIGNETVYGGGQPQPIKKPKGAPKNDPPVKWSSAAYGLKVSWSVIIEVEIENKKYKSSSARAALDTIAPYSVPPGVYKCRSATTTFFLADGSKRTTPYVHTPTFVPANGVKAGNRLDLDLYFPKNSDVLGCYVAYEGALDAKVAAKTIAFWNDPKGGGKLTMPEKVSGKAVIPFPPRISVLLQDGWTKTVGEADSMASEKYTVRRVK